MMKPLFLVGALLLCVPVGCRKRGAAKPSGTGTDATSAVSTADGAGGQSFASPPPQPASAPPPVNEAVQFYPPEPVNMYASARPGDYQTQLDAYNRVFRKWTQSASIVPNDLTHLMGIYNSPKPPQPPPGRRLVLDRKTVTVSLQ